MPNSWSCSWLLAPSHWSFGCLHHSLWTSSTHNQSNAIRNVSFSNVYKNSFDYSVLLPKPIEIEIKIGFLNSNSSSSQYKKQKTTKHTVWEIEFTTDFVLIWIESVVLYCYLYVRYAYEHPSNPIIWRTCAPISSNFATWVTNLTMISNWIYITKEEQLTEMQNAISIE